MLVSVQTIIPTPAQIVLYGPLLLICAVALIGLVRIFLLAIRDGVQVIVMAPRSLTLADISLLLIGLLLDIYLFSRPFFPQLDTWLYTQSSSAALLGVGLMTAGIWLMIRCWLTMGNAWRIGVPAAKEASQTLITDGLYAYSRNPIYFGIMGFIIGTLILAPGPFTVIVASASFFLIENLIKREEAFMQQAFGAAYTTYCSKVRRWI